MITRTMRKWLEIPIEERLPLGKKTVQYCVYMNRIQKRIEEELRTALWLAVNRPDILLGKSVSINAYGHETKWTKDRSRERLKTLLLIIKALSKGAYVELVKKFEELENEQDS